MTHPATDVARARSTRARPSDDELLDAALAVFAQRGFRAATMSEVASRSNSTKPTLYAHFGDKDTLHTRVLEREADVFRAALFRAYEASSGLALAEQVDADTRALFDYAAAHPDGFAILFGRDLTSAVVEVREQVLADVNRQIAQRVHAYLVRTGATTRQEPSGEEQQLAAMLAGVAVSAAQHALAGSSSPEQACRLASAFSAAALAGLAGAGPASAGPAGAG